MPRNVEIKAKIHDLETFKEIAKSLSDTEGTIIHQHDTFYPAQGLRLKLRRLSENDGQLISYKRVDTDGPKLSDFSIYVTLNPDSLNEVLSKSYGVRGVVEKKRTLYISGQTRIHVDEVKHLGHFMELEVCLRDDQSVEEGQSIANGLMEKLNVKQGDLLEGAYIDLIERQ